MTQNRLITITDIQRSGSGDESTQVITRGSLTGGAEDYTLRFTEMLDGENECTTRLRVRQRRCVSLLRTGAYNSEMMIEEGRRHNCHYVTPYGDFMIGIFAKSVDSKVNLSGGKLRMHYTIDFFGGLAAEKIMEIEIGAKQEGAQSRTGKEKSGITVVAKQLPPQEKK